MTAAPFPHQRDGAKFALARRASLLGHEMGTGKTRTTIMVLDEMEAEKVLVVCPPIGIGVWAAEMDKWSDCDRRIQLIRRGTDRPDPNANVIVVGYALLSRSRELVGVLRGMRWDVVVLDEAHALKERGTRRTKAIYGPRCRGEGGIVQRAERVVLLTGTPILNSPYELWTHLRALTPDLLGPANGFDQFTEKFCEITSRWISGRQISKVGPLKRGAAPELRRMLQPFMHRVKKVDVLKDLPPMLWGLWPVALSDCTVPSEVAGPWAALERRLKAQMVGMSDDDILAAAYHSEHMATQRRMCGVIKASAVVEAIETELEGGKEKVIVFAHHTTVIDMLELGLKAYGPVVIDGRTAARDRDGIVQRFQTDPDCRVFIGQNTAASTAITLTAASSVWIVEPDWTPAINAQAAARAHRPGQRDSVTVRMLTLEGSIDETINAILVRKSADINQVIERGTSNGVDNHPV